MLKIVYSLLLSISLLINSCVLLVPPDKEKYLPYNYPLSKWESIDKNVVILIDENGEGHGNIFWEGQIYNRHFIFNRLTEEILILDDYNYINSIIDSTEMWRYDINESSFNVEVMKSQFFDENMKFEVHLVEEKIT